MPELLSSDLRRRVVECVEDGVSRREAAARFEIVPSSAVNMLRLWKETGSVEPRPRVGLRHGKLKPHREFRCKDSPLIRRNRDCPRTTSYVAVHFKRMAQNIRLPESFVFHCLRHTYASLLLRANTPPIVVARQLGHKNMETTIRVILARRTVLGLSQTELAQRMNTDKSTISRWESGETALNADRLLEVSAALKIPVAALLGQEDGAVHHVEAADEIDPLLLAAWRRLSKRSRSQLVQFALTLAGEG